MDFVHFATLQAAAAQPGVFEAFLPMAIVFGIFYVLVIGPSRKKQADQEKLLSTLKNGDRVLLSSGIFGVVTGVDDKEKVVYVRIADNTKIRVQRSAIAALEGAGDVPTT